MQTDATRLFHRRPGGTDAALWLPLPRKALRLGDLLGGHDPGNEIPRTGPFLLVIASGTRNREVPRKAEVGLCQTYFAVQTRRQEIRDQHPEQRRVEMRQRVKEANRSLTSAAKDAGVQNYGLFHDAGYRGLYGMGLSDLKSYKGLPERDDLLDRAGRAELAANEFRITQAEQKLRRERVKGETAAIDTHRQVGQAVRTTIEKLGGTLPENLRPEPSIKQMTAKRRPRIAGVPPGRTKAFLPAPALGGRSTNPEVEQ